MMVERKYLTGKNQGKVIIILNLQINKYFFKIFFKLIIL